MIKFAKISLAALTIGSAIATPAFAKTRAMTGTDLATLKRLGGTTVSPDGKMIAYQLRETDLEANKGRTDIWIMPADGGEARKLAGKPEFNEHSPSFSADGKYLYFLSNENKKEQLWRIAVAGGEAEKVSDLKADIAGFKLAPDNNSVAIWGDVARDCPEFGCEKDGNRANTGPGTGRLYADEDGFVRHWDSWEKPGNHSRIFVYDITAAGKLGSGWAADGSGKDGITADSPSKPFGGGEEIAWDPDSNTLLFVARKSDKAEPTSTNLDIYATNKNAAGPINITQPNLATDTAPAPSPDGKWLAYTAMKRPGYESDKLTVILSATDGSSFIDLTKDWDRSVYSIDWAPDSKSIYVTAREILDKPLFQIDLSGKVTRLTKGGNVGSVHPLANGDVIYSMNTLHQPTELYRLSRNGKVTQLTDVNGEALAKLNKVDVQRFDFAGANGDQVWGQIIKPAGAKGKLPTLFLVHGGPQGSFGDSWSFRWNPKVMASQGYAVVTIDFHGSTGYGQKFTDSINKDWGGKPLTDLKLGLAASGKVDSQVDTSNVCALGASYGGYMMNWIAGQWNDGFKCLINHAGLFDMRSFYYATEELWFPRWDFGGSYSEQKELYEKWNPANHVDKWKTPMFVIHGEKDFRVPYGQSLMAFTALKERNIPSKLLMFPDENHWILKAKNSIQWHDAVFDWVGSYLKKIR